MRDSLERKLGAALARARLTLLCAPAGFGKTAALTRQLELLPEDTALAWIAADEGDDLHRFLVCLFAALEPFDLPWRAAPDALISAAVDTRGDRRAVVAGLINAFAASDVARGLMVLDDAHRIGDRAVFELLDLLLERLPTPWGFVISSRVEPPMALARLRAAGELAELRQADLRFDREEVAALALENGYHGDTEQLLKRTDGWAAGLRLTLNAAQIDEDLSKPLTSRKMDRHLFDYLAAEVLDQMPAELREFLLRCSVLPELTVNRCIDMSDNTNAARLLEEIEQQGLFVSTVDGPEPALTLHDLFRECLAERLRCEHPDALPELLCRAAAGETDPIRRLTFLVRAEAWAEADSVLEEVASELIAAGAIEPVLRLIDQFPSYRRERSPTLALVRGKVAWAQWDWRAMAAAMRQARIGFDRADDDAHRLQAELFEAVALDGSGLIAESRARLSGLAIEDADIETQALGLALRTWHAIDGGEFKRVASCYSDVLDVLEQTDRLELWYQCFQRPLYVWLPGMKAPLTRFVDGVMRRNGDTPSLMRAIAYVMAAWLAFWRGDLEQAAERVRQAQEDERWLGMPARLRMFVNSAQAIVQAGRGEREAALAAIDALLGYFDAAPSSGPSSAPTSMLAHYLLFAVRLADTLGDAEAMREFASRLPPPAEITNYSMLQAPLATVPARLAALEGRHAEAAEAWEAVLVDEAALDVLGLAQEARLRHACALLALERPLDAAATLKLVLRDVAESGEVGGIVLAGKAVLIELAAAAWRDELDWTELVTLRAWARRFAGDYIVAAEHANGGGLSPREMQVLGRIAAGESNKLIARAFDLSPHTVKRHVANILDKLDVNSRSEAARWYQSHR